MRVNNIFLLINVFFLQSYLIRFQIGNYPTNAQEALIMINAAAFIYAMPIKALLKALKKHWLLVSLAGLTLFSIIFVQILNQLDFLRHLKFLFFGMVLSFIFLESFKTEKERENGLRVMGIGALAFGIFSVFYNLFGLNVAHDFRLLGPLDAAVYLAYYLAPFFIFFSIKAVENFKDKSNLVYAILLAILLVATRSMGALGTSILVLLAYFLRKQFSKKTLAISAIILCVASVVIFYSKVLPTLQTNYSSLDERGEIWTTAGELLKEPRNFFLGVGFGQFEAHYIQTVDSVLGRPPLDYKVLQPHNIFLLFIFHYGVLGLALILFIFFRAIKNYLKNPKNADLPSIANFILLYFLIHGLIDTPIFKNDLLFIFLLITAIAIPQPTGRLIKSGN